MVVFSQLNLQEKLKLAEKKIISSNEAACEQLKSIDDLKTELEKRETVLRNIVAERDTLMSELEELDQQNQEAAQV